MSSKITDKKINEIKFEIQESFQVNNIITPFSLFFMHKEKYIYTGEERIPFKKRHPFYKVILLNEFRESKD
jgi:hypothetical protein